MSGNVEGQPAVSIGMVQTYTDRWMENQPRDPGIGDVVGQINGLANTDGSAMSESEREFMETWPARMAEFANMDVEPLTDTWLSDREAEVAVLKSYGLTHRGIAIVLDQLAVSTVDEYWRRVEEKYRKASELIDAIDGMEQIDGPSQF